MFDVSRILAIPELEPDKLQMGLSNTSWAVIAASGKTKDGSPAKASVLKQERKGVSQQDIKKAGEKVGIKGDRKLSEVNQSSRGMAITDKKRFQSEVSAAKKIKSAIPLGSRVKGGKVSIADGKRLKDKYFREALQKRHREIDAVKLKGKQGDVNVVVDFDGNRVTAKKSVKGTNYPNGLSVNETKSRSNRREYSVTHSETGWSLVAFNTKKEAERFVKSATKDSVDFSKLDEKGLPNGQNVVNVINNIRGRDIIPPASKTTRQKRVKPPTDKKPVQITVGDRQVRIGNPANYRKVSINYHPVWGYSVIDSTGKELAYTDSRGKEAGFSFSSKSKAEKFAKSVEMEVQKQFK